MGTLGAASPLKHALGRTLTLLKAIMNIANTWLGIKHDGATRKQCLNVSYIIL